MNQQESQLSTKVRFLQNELMNSQEELKEFKQLLDLNKEIIKTLSSEKLNNVPQMQQTITPPTTKENVKIVYENTYQKLYIQLTQENTSLYLLNSLLTRQRDEARGQALVCDQIAESSQQREIEIMMESEAKLISLKRLLSDSEGALTTLEAQIQFNKKKLITKQIVSPTPDIMGMHSQTQYLENKITKLQFEKNQFKEDKNGLLAKNKVLQEQLQSYKVQSSPVGEEIIEDESLKDFNDGKSYSRGDLIDDSINDMDLPDKVNCIASPKTILPILDMKKAQKVQKLNILKQERMDEEEEINYKQQLQIKMLMEQQSKNQILNNNSRSQTPQQHNQQMFTSPNKLYLQLESTTDQLKASLKELAACRMSLQDELFTTKNLETQQDELNRRLQECYHRNEILLLSQVKYEQKWATINRLYHEYYQFFQEHQDKENQINLLTNRSDQIHPQILSPRGQSTRKNLSSHSLLQFPLQEQDEIQNDDEDDNQEADRDSSLNLG